MRLLIAYDGSECSGAALDDLTHAGLPPSGDAIVMSVAEVWLPPPPPSAAEVVEQSVEAKGSFSIEPRYLQASKAVDEAESLAKSAAMRFQVNFPGWTVKAEGAWGSPTWELYEKAESWLADLIVVGSHGRSTLGRLFLGSISQWLLNEARCSVRVARGKLDEPDFPIRVVLGLDGSASAQNALDEVCSRNWPSLSEVCVVVVEQPLHPTVVGELVPPVRRSVADSNEQEREAARDIAQAAVEQLEASGLRAKAMVEEGDPKVVLVRTAEEWRADCIFLGATGTSNRLERFLLGSVAGAVASRAHCSVEVVRRGINRSDT